MCECQITMSVSRVAQLCQTLCDTMNHSTPGLPVHHQLPEFTQIHVHQLSDAIQPSHPLSSPSPPALNLSQHQGPFQWVSSLHQVPKYWSFSFSISPSNEYSGLISFWMDWLDLLPVQGTFKRLLQHHSSKALEYKVEQKCQKSWSKEEILKVASIPLRMAEFQIITLRRTAAFHYCCCC